MPDSHVRPGGIPANDDIRKLARLAQEIRARLPIAKRARWRRLAERLGAIAERIVTLGSIRKRLSVCAGRGCDRAAAKCPAMTESALGELCNRLQDFEQERKLAPVAVPSLRDIIGEPKQVEDEFGEMDFNPGEKSVSVTTDPIALDGVYLGPFEIVLRLDGLDESDRRVLYRIDALEPNPASTADRATHPRVSDGRHCPGDGGEAIHAALRSGRIADFFVLVRRGGCSGV